MDEKYSVIRSLQFIKNKVGETMKIALVQLSMSKDINANLKKSLEYCDKARDSYLLFFPEIQLSPFFPQYEKQNVDRYCLKIESDELVLVYQ